MSAAGLSVEQANDFSALESHIVGLLQRAVAGLSPAVHVLTAAELADVKVARQKVPAIHVISTGFTPQAEADPRLLRLLHGWYVVAAVSNVGTQRSGSAARRAAGPLLARAMSALLAERLPGAAKPMTATRAPAGAYDAGYFYLPSAWQVETVFRKQAT
jgi:hypothetical protein